MHQAAQGLLVLGLVHVTRRRGARLELPGQQGLPGQGGQAVRQVGVRRCPRQRVGDLLEARGSRTESSTQLCTPQPRGGGHHGGGLRPGAGDLPHFRPVTAGSPSRGQGEGRAVLPKHQRQPILTEPHPRQPLRHRQRPPRHNPRLPHVQHLKPEPLLATRLGKQPILARDGHSAVVDQDSSAAARAQAHRGAGDGEARELATEQGVEQEESVGRSDNKTFTDGHALNAPRDGHLPDLRLLNFASLHLNARLRPDASEDPSTLSHRRHGELQNVPEPVLIPELLHPSDVDEVILLGDGAHVAHRQDISPGAGLKGALELPGGL
mmetsp:Transcript_22668/g.57935  ORF Transcript_22668/g.57935 Transcript_22668/m.57935 type:complete len:323 (-) Transcript_22668:235-1203(-)